MNHQIKLFGPAIPQSSYGTPYFWFDSLSGFEKLNDLFEYELIVKVRDEFLKPAHGYQGLEGYVSKAQADAGGSPATHLDLKTLIGTEIAIQVRLDGLIVDLNSLGGINSDAENTYQSSISGARFYRGLVSRVEALAVKNRHAMYKITLVPWVWLLKKTTDYKIYQNKNVLQIIEEVLLDYPYPVDYRCTQDYPVLDFQVQYGESDYDFIVRLMQEHGINFHFEHSKAHLTFVLSDHNAAYQPMQAKAYQQLNIYPPSQRFPIQAEYIEHFEPAQQLVSGKLALSDFQFKQPSLIQKADEQFIWDHAHAEHEIYEWQQGDFLDSNAGQIKAKPWIEALYQQGYRALGRGHLKGLQTGFKFTLDHHPNTESNRGWIVLGTQTLIQDISEEKADNQFYDSQVEFLVQPEDQILRPDRTYVKPQGRPQTATVVGPSGEEIYTDQYGRVRVQFHWDRYGAKDENSTCWLRVSTAWAGNNFGTIHLPRIGQEVIVDFFNADPDMPFVAGRLTNPEQMPLWDLPSQKALSGIKSKELGGSRNNHLIMDDTNGQIQVQLKSDHKNTQLNLGYITRIPDPSGRQVFHGEGFELRTEGIGKLSATQGIFFSTYGKLSPLKAIDETAGILKDAFAQQKAASEHAKSTLSEEDREKADDGALNSLEEDLSSISGQPSDDSSPKNETSADGSRRPEFKQPHMVMSSPAGLALATPKNAQLSSQMNTMVTAKGDVTISANQQIMGMAKTGLNLYVQEQGARLYVSQGKIDVQAQDDNIELTAQKHIKATAQTEDLEAKAKKNISLTAETEDLSLTAQKNVNVTANTESISITAKKNIGLDASDQNLALSAKQKIGMQSKTDEIEIIANKVLRLISEQDKIELKASKEISLIAENSYITLKGSGIEQGTLGKWEAKGASISFGGPDALSSDISPACKTAELMGSPVNPISGAKVLPGEIDFSFSGAVPLVWGRAYFSDQIGNGWLGQGWSLPFSKRIERIQGVLYYIDEQDRRFALPELEVNGKALFLRMEHLYVRALPNAQYLISSIDGLKHWRFGALNIDAHHPQGEDCLYYPLIAEEDVYGHQNRIIYDQHGLPCEIEDSLGRQFFIQFNNIAKESMPTVLRLTEVKMLPSLNKRKAQGVAECLVRYDYNEHGDLIAVKDHTGLVTRRFSYQNHMMVKHEDAVGFIAEYEYDYYEPKGKVIRHWNNVGEQLKFHYQPQHTLISDQLSRTQHIYYDGHQQVTKRIRYDGNYTVTYRDDNGRALETIDEVGRSTKYYYNINNMISAVEDSKGQLTSYEYNARHQLIKTTFPNGLEHRQEYDDYGNLTLSHQDIEGTRTYQYDAYGRMIAMTNAKGNRYAYQYNDEGLLIQQTDCSNKVLSYQYDEQDRIVGVVDALGQQTRYQYNAHDQITHIIYADGRQESLEYDAQGRLLSVIDPNQQKTQFQYTVDGLIQQRTNALGDHFQYQYDAVRRLSALVNENGEKYRFEYDTNDLLTKEIGFDGKTTRYEYNPSGELIKQYEYGQINQPYQDLDQLEPLQIHAYTRDTLGRLIRKESYSSETKQTEHLCLSYDEIGNIVQVLNNTTAIRIDYDELNRVTQELTWSHGLNHINAYQLLDPPKKADGVRYSYDALGNITQLKLSDGKVIDQAFYGSGYLHHISINGQWITDIERDDLHREVKRSQGKLVTEFKLDAVGHLKQQIARIEATNTALHHPPHTIERQYYYDPHGNLTQLKDPHQTKDYAYDPLGRLISAGEERYAFDPAHNIIEQKSKKSTKPQAQGTREESSLGLLNILDREGIKQDHQHQFKTDELLDERSYQEKLKDPEWHPLAIQSTSLDPKLAKIQSSQHAIRSNRVTHYQGVDYVYDSLGNLRKRIEGSRTLILDYNALNQVIRATIERKHQENDVWCYEYDGLGRRISKVKQDAPETLTRFIWQGNRLIQEANHKDKYTYIYRDQQSFEPLAQVVNHIDTKGKDEEVLETYYFHTDQIGVPREVTNEKGELIWKGQYQAWGKLEKHTTPLTSTSGTVHQPFRLQNQYYDEETGLHYNLMRYYDPHYGRFISQDPIKLLGGQNLYTYAPNTTRWADATGLFVNIVAGAAIGAVVGVGAQFVGDLVSGNKSSWEDYAGAAVGGAVGGALIGSGVGIVAGIAVGAGSAAAGNAAAQGLKIASGKQCNFDWGELGINAAFGGILGGAFAAVAPALGNALSRFGRPALNAVRNGMGRAGQAVRNGFNRAGTAVRMGAGRAQNYIKHGAIRRPNTSNIKYPKPDSAYKIPGKDWWDYPPKNGFKDGISKAGNLKPGKVIDRFGKEDGSFLAPYGDDFPARALPPGSLTEPYHVYQVRKPIPMREGEIAPAFDMPGGGYQYQIDWVELGLKHRLPDDFQKDYAGGGIKWLVDVGYLDRLTNIGGILP